MPKVDIIVACNDDRRVSGKPVRASQTNSRCFADSRRGDVSREVFRNAAHMPGRGSRCRHQNPTSLAARSFRRSGFRLWRGSTRTALRKAPLRPLHFPPKSMIHLSTRRRVRSMPLTHGRKHIGVGRPFGFSGICSHARASRRDVECAALRVPKKAMPCFPQRAVSPWSGRIPHPVRSALMRATACAVKAQLRHPIGAEADQRHPHGHALDDPFLVIPGIEDHPV